MENPPKRKRRRGCLVGCLVVLFVFVLLISLSLGAALGFVPLPAQSIALGNPNGLNIQISYRSRSVTSWGVAHGQRLVGPITVAIPHNMTICDDTVLNAGQIRVIILANCSTYALIPDPGLPVPTSVPVPVPTLATPGSPGH